VIEKDKQLFGYDGGQLPFLLCFSMGINFQILQSRDENAH
jgi:hypothetical protein